MSILHSAQPWLANSIKRLAEAQTRLKLWRCSSVGEDVRVIGKIDLVDAGLRHIGNRVVFDGSRCPIELKAEPGSELSIGDDVHIEGGVSLWVYSRIVVGSRVRLGAFCQLLDNHFHIPGQHRTSLTPKSNPVIVEDDVVIEPHAILLSGAHIERGSIVRARSVITRRVPPFSEVRGVPAVVRPLSK